MTITQDKVKEVLKGSYFFNFHGRVKTGKYLRKGMPFGNLSKLSKGTEVGKPKGMGG